VHYKELKIQFQIKCDNSDLLKVRIPDLPFSIICQKYILQSSVSRLEIGLKFNFDLKFYATQLRKLVLLFSRAVRTFLAKIL